MSHKKNQSKKNKRKNLLINILAGFLILLSIALIFNANIRDMFMIWNTNKYQVSQVTKEEIEEVKIVTPDRVDVIDERDGIKEITLVTCEDANAVERIIVKGNLTEVKSYAETPSDILEAFNKPYKQFYE